jgi:hypothetical protein
VGGRLDFQDTISWFIGVFDGSSSESAGGVSLADVYELWVRVRGGVIAPVLQVAVWVCMVMSVMLAVEAVYNSVVSLGVKVIGWRPEWRFKWEPMAGDDEEKGADAHYPMVLVQIPMYNELEVRGDHNLLILISVKNTKARSSLVCFFHLLLLLFLLSCEINTIYSSMHCLIYFLGLSCVCRCTSCR